MLLQPNLNIFTQADVKLPGGVPDYINLMDVGLGHKKPRSWRGLNWLRGQDLNLGPSGYECEGLSPIGSFLYLISRLLVRFSLCFSIPRRNLELDETR